MKKIFKNIIISLGVLLCCGCLTPKPNLRSNTLLVKNDKNQIVRITLLAIPDLKKLPKNWKKKYQLVQKVDIVGCNKLPIEEIQRTAQTWKYLKELSIAQDLEYIPSEISKLNISKLDLRNNQIENIGSDFESDSLKYLFLDRNDLGRLDNNKLNFFFSKLADRTSLKFLSLTENYLYALPKSFEKFKELKYLYIGHNSFQEFPKEICELHNLEIIGIDFMPSLMEYPPYLDSLPSGIKIEFSSLSKITNDQLISLKKRYPFYKWER